LRINFPPPFSPAIAIRHCRLLVRYALVRRSVGEGLLDLVRKRDGGVICGAPPGVSRHHRLLTIFCARDSSILRPHHVHLWPALQRALGCSCRCQPSPVRRTDRERPPLQGLGGAPWRLRRQCSACREVLRPPLCQRNAIFPAKTKSSPLIIFECRVSVLVVYVM